ncbi:class I SAM-dependent methyltransferase [Clostridium sp. B9]|uniref:class I SAM-dependent methyltransferase n=1 Tax=Clostridium sp. B9 TaxID=3423224 RepID=UPI003D2F1EE2
MDNKINKEIIITNENTLTMLDNILEKRDALWWDKFYSDKEKPIPFFKNIPDENLISYCKSNILTKGKALDIGCGNGRNSLYLSKQGFAVTAIDISNNSISWAKDLSKKYDKAPNFLCKSLFDFTDEPKSFNFINDSGCFHHIKPHRRSNYFETILKYLNDDGYFSMTCFDLEGGANISDYDVYRDYSMHGGLGFSEYKLKTILESHFKIIEFRKMKESKDPNIYGKDFLWVVLMKKKLLN